MSYIVVRAAENERTRQTLERYLYEGQKIVGEPVRSEFDSQYFIVDTGTNDTYRSQYITDRLNSGPFGAKLFTSLPEAELYIQRELR
jgi:hypothetical protein